MLRMIPLFARDPAGNDASGVSCMPCAILPGGWIRDVHQRTNGIPSCPTNARNRLAQTATIWSSSFFERLVTTSGWVLPTKTVSSCRKPPTPQR